MIAHPIEILLLNLSTAAGLAAAERVGRIEAANAIGVIIGQHDMTDLPSWPLPTAARYNSLRSKRLWDLVMAVGTTVTKLGGHEAMTENRMTLDEKDLALGGMRAEAIAAIVARRGITAAEAAEIVERWLPCGKVYWAALEDSGLPVTCYFVALLDEATTVAELHEHLPWVFAFETADERQIVQTTYRRALQRIAAKDHAQ